MSSAVDFAPLRLTMTHERQGRKQMRDMLGAQWWRKRGRSSWAGFAAEHALVDAMNALPGPAWCRPAPTLTYDLAIGGGVEALKAFEAGAPPAARVEVKTRAVTAGWTDPEKFDYVVIPTHEGREPIKPEADQVWFTWFSAAQPRRLWLLGYLRGVEEFRRRSVFYREGEPLPRGGWAKDGGAYAIEIKQLRPFPRGLFQEDN